MGSMGSATPAPYVYTTAPPPSDPYYPGNAADQANSPCRRLSHDDPAYAAAGCGGYGSGSMMMGSGMGSGSMDMGSGYDMSNPCRRLSHDDPMYSSMGCGSDYGMGSAPYYGSGYYPENYISPEEQASIVEMAPEYA